VNSGTLADFAALSSAASQAVADAQKRAGNSNNTAGAHGPLIRSVR